MKDLYSLIFIALISATALMPAMADDRKGDIKDTVGPMSESVLLARLKNLGYSDIKITKSSPLRYRIEATKDGKPIAMYLHPQTGHMVEVGPDEKPLHAWHMPIERQETGLRRPRPN